MKEKPSIIGGADGISPLEETVTKMQELLDNIEGKIMELPEVIDFHNRNPLEAEFQPTPSEIMDNTSGIVEGESGTSLKEILDMYEMDARELEGQIGELQRQVRNLPAEIKSLEKSPSPNPTEIEILKARWNRATEDLGDKLALLGESRLKVVDIKKAIAALRGGVAVAAAEVVEDEVESDVEGIDLQALEDRCYSRLVRLEPEVEEVGFASIAKDLIVELSGKMDAVWDSLSDSMRAAVVAMSEAEEDAGRPYNIDRICVEYLAAEILVKAIARVAGNFSDALEIDKRYFFMTLTSTNAFACGAGYDRAGVAFIVENAFVFYPAMPFDLGDNNQRVHYSNDGILRAGDVLQRIPANGEICLFMGTTTLGEGWDPQRIARLMSSAYRKIVPLRDPAAFEKVAAENAANLPIIEWASNFYYIPDEQGNNVPLMGEFEIGLISQFSNLAQDQTKLAARVKKLEDSINDRELRIPIEDGNIQTLEAMAATAADGKKIYGLRKGLAASVFIMNALKKELAALSCYNSLWELMDAISTYDRESKYDPPRIDLEQLLESVSERQRVYKGNVDAYLTDYDTSVPQETGELPLNAIRPLDLKVLKNSLVASIRQDLSNRRFSADALKPTIIDHLKYLYSKGPEEVASVLITEELASIDDIVATAAQEGTGIDKGRLAVEFVITKALLEAVCDYFGSFPFMELSDNDLREFVGLALDNSLLVCTSSPVSSTSLERVWNFRVNSGASSDYDGRFSYPGPRFPRGMRVGGVPIFSYTVGGQITSPTPFPSNVRCLRVLTTTSSAQGLAGAVGEDLAPLFQWIVQFRYPGGFERAQAEITEESD